MRHKGGALPLYDAVICARRARSPLMLLGITLLFALVVASFGRYAFFSMLPLAAYPLYFVLIAETGIKNMFRKLLPLSLFVLFIGVWDIFFDRSMISLSGVSFRAGWLSFATIALKFMLCVSAVMTMFSLVGFDSLCRALASLRLPVVLINLLFLFSRYIELITGEMRNIIRARLFRCGKISISQSGNICGPLVLRCFARSRRINDALACRGYAEAIYGGAGVRTGFSFSDKIFGVAWTVFFLFVRLDYVSAIADLILRYGD